MRRKFIWIGFAILFFSSVLNAVPAPSWLKPDPSRRLDTDPRWQDLSGGNHPNARAYQALKSAKAKLCLDKPLSSKINDTSKGIGKKLKITLVDLDNVERPDMVHANGYEMLYAASTAKVGILYAFFQALDEGYVKLTPDNEDKLKLMMRVSDNTAASQMLMIVGAGLGGKSETEKMRKGVIYADSLFWQSGLYNSQSAGGLWLARGFGLATDFDPAPYREPMLGLTHAANANSLAQFYTLMAQKKLVDSAGSKKMLELSSLPGLRHKFVGGILEKYNCMNSTHNECLKAKGISLYRKSGSWSNWHSDVILVGRPNDSYILSAMCENNLALDKACATQNNLPASVTCDQMMKRLIQEVDGFFD